MILNDRDHYIINHIRDNWKTFIHNFLFKAFIAFNTTNRNYIITAARTRSLFALRHYNVIFTIFLTHPDTIYVHILEEPENILFMSNGKLVYDKYTPFIAGRQNYINFNIYERRILCYNVDFYTGLGVKTN